MACEFFHINCKEIITNTLLSYPYLYFRRLGVLSDQFGGWMPAYCHGLVEVRRLFPQVGIAADVNGMDMAVPHDAHGYPGNQTLHEWIVNSAHPIENMIQVYVFCKKNILGQN